MPTIDDLPAANSVSDTDEIMVSQSDIARKATRAQLLSGVQPALALPQNVVLGRLSAGVGEPETILIGANLTIADGILNAPSAFEISALPAGITPQPNDLVAVAESGKNAAVNYATFIGGMASLSGIVGSNLVVTTVGGVGSRRIADVLADALSIEAFGAVGDGLTDDTAAFVAATQAGKPIRLDGRIYIVNGPLLVASNSTWLGVTGETVIRRAQVTVQQIWIEFAGSQLNVSGVMFDANKLAAANSPVTQVDVTCLAANFENCQFMNAFGSSVGSGLLISCGVGATHTITSCKFSNNEIDGLNASGSGTITVNNCVAQNNGACGISMSAETACWITGTKADNNNLGLSIGAWQQAAPMAAMSPLCVVESNFFSNNANWGLAVSGYGACVRDNVAAANGIMGGGGGIISRLAASLCTGNRVSGGATGIDARTSWGSQVTSNHVSGTTTGMLLGGCRNLFVGGNFLLMNQWGLDVSAIEPSLSATLTGPVSITDNWIGFTTALGGGIFVHDGMTGISIVDNDLNGWGSATVNQGLWLHTDQAVVSGNRWNNLARFPVQGGNVGALSSVVIPDLADDVMIASVEGPIESLVTTHQVDTLGQISFIRVNAGGSGYTEAQIAISGTGRGAAAAAIVSGGQLVAIVLTNPGSGYGPIGTGAAVTITGDGSDAAATAYVGLPVLEGRRIRLVCNCTVQLAVSGTSPPQQNWTNFAATIPALGGIEIEGSFGTWRAVSFPSVDYVQPTGDGGAVLQSASGGDVTLRPSAGGVLQVASASELSGCTFSVGRGAPTGVVTAPPGSDFRNLDGGAGNTLWLKQTGTDANGWVAVA